MNSRIKTMNKQNATIYVATLTLSSRPRRGLATKARACKVVGQEGSLGVTSHVPESAKKCEGMNSHTPK